MEQPPQNDSGVSISSVSTTLKSHDSDAPDVLLDQPPSSNVTQDAINIRHLDPHTPRETDAKISDDARVVSQEHKSHHKDPQPVDGQPQEPQILDGQHQEPQPGDGQPHEPQPLDPQHHEPQPLDLQHHEHQPLDLQNHEHQPLDLQHHAPQPPEQGPHEGDGAHTAQLPEASPAEPRRDTQFVSEPEMEATDVAATIETIAAQSPNLEDLNINPRAPEPPAAAKDEAGPAPKECSPDSPSLCVGRPESLLQSPLTHPNGLSMFPSMSTSEQEAMSRDALSQAEASIVADNFDSLDSLDGRRTDDESDGGYDSDGFSSASTSAESMVRDYMYENGRRYHRFREGSYNFPNDDVEQEREDMKHAMVKLLCSQKLHFAPIGNYPQEVLDIGTGTGIWAIEMGDQFPSAHVLGIDLSPIQPDWLPPNVRFLVDDVESPWLHQRNHFDYIHSRHTVMAIRDWTRLFRRAYEHLKPGGWIELQEIHHAPRSALPDGQFSPEHGVAQFWARVNEGLNTLGVDLNTAAGGLLAEKMREAGFTNVTERVFHVPIGTWPKNKVLKTVGLYWRTILLDGIQAIALGPLTRGLRWDREQVEVFLMDVRRAYHDNAALMYMPLHIIYAQKPENMV